MSFGQRLQKISTDIIRDVSRPNAHVIGERAEQLLTSSLPDHWIKRPLPRDYGVDFEVEIAESRILTGKRFWVQLKGFSRGLPCHDTLPWERRGPQPASALDKPGLAQRGVSDVPHVRVPVSTKLLSYALRCDFPLLLAAADLVGGEVYIVPLRDHAELVLDVRTPAWRQRKTTTIHIDARHRISDDLRSSNSLLRWYAMDPARRAALSHLAYFAHELRYETQLIDNIGDGQLEDDEQALLSTARVVRRYVERAMSLDILYGDDGLALFKALHLPAFELGLAAAAKIERDIPARLISFEHTTVQVFRLHAAVKAIEGAVASYQPFREAFVLTPARTTC
jgi:hypothetical protein